jgi:4-hydroxythreonine-4-phosphate dehydrogenase
MRKPIVAITIGDWNGIGPEIGLKALRDRSIHRICTPVLVGPWPAFAQWCRRLKLRPPCLTIIEPPATPAVDISPGRVSASAGRAAAASVRCATLLALRGRVDALVTAPVSKQALHKGGIEYPGQTEFLKDITHSAHAGMMLVAGSLRVGLLTIHVPLRRVASLITKPLVTEQVRLFHRSLQVDWSLPRPAIALLGLNPHAGEGGDIGTEEEEILRPAIRRLRKEGMDIAGPFPADAFFARGRHATFHAVVAPYHDQGLIPLKMAARGKGVNVTVGLPIVRTSPDHGTAFDIAGGGTADPSSMIEAIRTAAGVVRRRRKHKGALT